MAKEKKDKDYHWHTYPSLFSEIELMADLRRLDVSTLLAEYAIEGIRRDKQKIRRQNADEEVD